MVAKGLNSENVGKVAIGSIRVIRLLIAQDSTLKSTMPETLRKLTFYTNFVSDMAAADSAPKIKAVLESYSAPVRSYRTLRSSSLSTSFIAYPGVYLGRETSFYDSKDNRAAVGITAPIGFASHWASQGWSHTAFLSLVDIGAALTYRFNQDTADLPQQIHLGQIISPGLFYSLGFPKSPISFKAGMQYAPLLRAIKDAQNVVEDKDLWRVSIGFSVDIPIFIISSR